jgi:uncharacterized repeat protein (TIGR03803 family)
MVSRLQRSLFPLATLLMLVAAQSPAQTAAVSDLVVFNSATFGNPAFVPARGRTGLLYGVLGGSSEDPGTVFSFSSSGTTRTLYTAAGSSGYGQFSSLTLAADGNFYGGTNGAAVIGTGAYGNIFRVTPGGSFTVLHYLNGGSDGAFPFGAPVEASNGNLYGVTWGGCCHNSTVYEHTPQGTFSVIYTFSSAQCLSAQSIIQGSDGNLYISCSSGGTNGNGSIVKLSTTGKLLSYYLFPGGAGGSEPAGLVQASDGNYYGATLFGGIPGSGDGTIFRMTPQNEVTILYTFDPRHSSHDGTLPGYPIQATDGNLYGVTFSGGLYGYGTIFRISLQGEYSQVYSFPSTVGSEPQFIMQDPSGTFYGSANVGSTDNYGSIFSLDMGLGPFITFVLPSGKVGQSAQILGQGLTGTTRVTFNGKAATKFSVVNDTYMTAVVPTGATTGRVVVTTPTGKLTSNVSFRILK